MKIPVTLNYDRTKVIGELYLDDDQALDWLTMGFAEEIQLRPGDTVPELTSISVILRATRVNTGLILRYGKLEFIQKEEPPIQTCNCNRYCQYRYQEGSLIGCGLKNEYCDFQAPRDSRNKRKKK